MTEDLSAEQTWRGRFWLPEKPDQVQQGVLAYDPHNGVTLSLVGGFDDRRFVTHSSGSVARGEGSGRFPVIHGAVSGSKPITLVDCLATHSPSSGPLSNIYDQEIIAARVLSGVLLDDPSAPVFSELTIELENLTEWDHRNDVVFHFEGQKWEVRVDPVGPLTVTVGDLTVELARVYRKPDFDVRRDRLEAATTLCSYFDIRSSQPKSMEDWFEVTKALQDLLTLAMDAPCALLKETLTPSEALFADEDAAARRAIEVYGQHIVVGEPDGLGVANRNALFTLGTEGVEFDKVIPQWLKIHADFRTTCDMIFGLKYVDEGYAQTKLITAVAAAESLHEALGVDPPISDEEFNSRRKNLLDSVPKDQQQWLSDKLGSNKHTLRQRLIDLASIPDSQVMEALLPNPGAWARATKNERNPVAHGGNMSRDVRLLNAIIQATTAVVLVNLLHRLGIPKARLMMALDYNRTLKVAARLAREQWPTVRADDGAEPHADTAIVDGRLS